MNKQDSPDELFSNFWSYQTDDLLHKLNTCAEGLKKEEAKQRLEKYGKNVIKSEKRLGAFRLLLSQFNTPIIYLLLFAAILAFILYDKTDALIILGILFISGLLSFIQERKALNAVRRHSSFKKWRYHSWRLLST